MNKKVLTTFIIISFLCNGIKNNCCNLESLTKQQLIPRCSLSTKSHIYDRSQFEPWLTLDSNTGKSNHKDLPEFSIYQAKISDCTIHEVHPPIIDAKLESLVFFGCMKRTSWLNENPFIKNPLDGTVEITNKKNLYMPTLKGSVIALGLLLATGCF